MIIRRRHTANFTTIGNALFDDERLEADELGVLSYLLSRPNDWEVRRPQLARRFGIGRESIKRILINSIRYGWMIGRKTRLSNGTFHTIYEVSDQPGPTLSVEEVKSALSLVSSEPQDSDADHGEPADHVHDSGPPPTGEPEAADQVRQTRSGASKEALPNTDSTRTESTQSVRAFSDVLIEWPPDHVLSTITAEAAYAALTDTKRIACYRGLKPYLADCRAQSRKICDLTTFIRQGRWERFAGNAPKPSLYVVHTRTAQAQRWREYFERAEPHKLALFDRMVANNGYTVQSEWPPPLPPKPQAQADAPAQSNNELETSK